MKFFKVLNSKVPQSSYSIYHNLFARIWEGFWVMKFIHRSHCFVCHNFCLLNHFEAFQSSCLRVCFKAPICMCLFQSSAYQLCVSKLLFTSIYVKALAYQCMSQKLLFSIVCLHEFWKVYEFWSSSQAWFILPYNICKSVFWRLWIFKFIKVHLLCATIYLHEIWKFFKFLSSSLVTLWCLPHIVHKYFKVLSFEAPQSSSFIC